MKNKTEASKKYTKKAKMKTNTAMVEMGDNYWTQLCLPPVCSDFSTTEF